MGINYNPRIVTHNIQLYYDTHNPKCYTPLTTTLYDLSNNGNNGIFINPAYSNDGVYDNMIYYDGTGTGDGLSDGSRVEFPSIACNSNPSLYPNGRTLIWVAKPEDTARRGLIYGSDTINHLEQFDAASFRTEARLQNGYSFGASNCIITAYVYDMFAIVFNNDDTTPTAKWYQNGISFYEKSMINSTPETDYFEPNALGRETGSTSYTYAPSYKGFIPIFMSYSIALTDAEVKQNFIALRGRYNL